MSTILTCTKCNGTGKRKSCLSDVPDYDCSACAGGARPFDDFDADALERILLILTTTRGSGKKGKRIFKKRCPVSGYPYAREKTRDERRAYYIWRMARFHGGIDVCMPMTGMDMAEGDPCLKKLDAVVDKVAEMQFGTSLGAAMRWGRALGYVEKVPAGLPAGAYECGPVTDQFKPLFEMAELR